MWLKRKQKVPFMKTNFNIFKGYVCRNGKGVAPLEEGIVYALYGYFYLGTLGSIIYVYCRLQEKFGGIQFFQRIASGILMF
jgi:hypothetical protein